MASVRGLVVVVSAAPVDDHEPGSDPLGAVRAAKVLGTARVAEAVLAAGRLAAANRREGPAVGWGMTVDESAQVLGPIAGAFAPAACFAGEVPCWASSRPDEVAVAGGAAGGQADS